MMHKCLSQGRNASSLLVKTVFFNILFVCGLHSDLMADTTKSGLEVTKRKVFQPVGKDSIGTMASQTNSSANNPKPSDLSEINAKRPNYEHNLNQLISMVRRHSPTQRSIILKLVNRNLPSESEIFLESIFKNRLDKLQVLPDFTSHSSKETKPPLVLEVEAFTAEPDLQDMVAIAQVSLLKGRKLKKVFETSFEFQTPRK